MYQCYLSAYNKPYLEENCKEFSIITTTIAAVLQMIVEKDTVMIQMCGSTIPCRLNNTPILSMLLVFLLGGVENNFQIQIRKRCVDQLIPFKEDNK